MKLAFAAVVLVVSLQVYNVAVAIPYQLPPPCLEIEEFLVNGTASCDSYAKTIVFKILLNEQFHGALKVIASPNGKSEPDFDPDQCHISFGGILKDDVSEYSITLNKDDACGKGLEKDIRKYTMFFQFMFGVNRPSVCDKEYSLSCIMQKTE